MLFKQIGIGLLMCSFHGTQTMEHVHTLLTLPTAFERTLAKYSVLWASIANITLSTGTRQVNQATTERIHQVDRILEARMHQANHSMEERIDQLSSTIVSSALCSVASFAALLGLHQAIHNVDYDTVPGQSHKKFVFGSALALLGTGYLYKRQADFKAKLGIRASERS